MYTLLQLLIIQLEENLKYSQWCTCVLVFVLLNVLFPALRKRDKCLLYLVIDQIHFNNFIHCSFCD